MTSQLTRAGLAIAAASIVIGLFPISNGDISCGNGFFYDRHTSAQDLADAREAAVDPQSLVDFADACDRTRQPIRYGVLALLVVGVALSLAGLGGRQKTTD